MVEEYKVGKFIHSDGAWLASLFVLEKEEIKWNGGWNIVLESRGAQNQDYYCLIKLWRDHGFSNGMAMICSKLVQTWGLSLGPTKHICFSGTK